MKTPAEASCAKPGRSKARPSFDFMRTILLAGIFLGLAQADDSGVTPRSKPADYPVHESVKTAEIAATLLAGDVVRKIFSDEVAKAYTVVEVAIYPAGDRSFDVDLLDFSLRAGGQVIHAEKPAGLMIPWSGAPRTATIGQNAPSVTAETGVIVARGTDPATGRPRTGTGTYESVEVSNYPRADNSPPPPRKPDQSAVQAKIADRALPQGATTKPVAGYLYFPRYGKKRKNDATALNYSKDDVSIDLKFPK